MKACEIKSVYFLYHVLMVSGGNFMKDAQDLIFWYHIKKLIT